MPIMVFLKKHKEDVIRIIAATMLCALVAVLIFAFCKDLLPYASDGDAFDTVYALHEQGAQDNNS